VELPAQKPQIVVITELLTLRLNPVTYIPAGHISFCPHEPHLIPLWTLSTDLTGLLTERSKRLSVLTYGPKTASREINVRGRILDMFEGRPDVFCWIPEQMCVCVCVCVCLRVCVFLSEAHW